MSSLVDPRRGQSVAKILFVEGKLARLSFDKQSSSHLAAIARFSTSTHQHVSGLTVIATRHELRPWIAAFLN